MVDKHARRTRIEKRAALPDLEVGVPTPRGGVVCIFLRHLRISGGVVPEATHRDLRPALGGVGLREAHACCPEAGVVYGLPLGQVRNKTSFLADVAESGLPSVGCADIGLLLCNVHLGRGLRRANVYSQAGPHHATFPCPSI